MLFTNLRWRLCLFFVLSAGLIYALLALAGGFMLETGLNSSFNEELKNMAVEIGDIIDMSNLEPELGRWRHEKTKNLFMPTIQIFGKKNQLLGESGPFRNVPFIATNGKDRISDIVMGHNHLRVFSSVVDEESEAAQLQLIVPLRQKDMAVKSYYNSCLILSPFLLLGLSLAGYLFARHATRPVEQSFDILRNFVADAGHELNTPLTILQANVEALSEDMTDIETTLPVIVRTCQRMSNLVSDLLFLAEQESPVHKNKCEGIIDLKSMADSLYEEFIRLYEAKGLVLQRFGEEGVTIYGDYEAIHRALTNLLKNALNYTEAGAINLRVCKSRTGHNAEVIVEDSGSGIPAENLSQIFDRFYRVQKHRSRASGGSGLGLAIVKAIIENHSGSIHVKSKPGEGSTFILELPLAS